jgi:3-oxoacyl-(acyl-carrier-protein) synthase
VIRAVAWCRADDCGAVVAARPPIYRPAPGNHAETIALIQHPVKYIGRMTDECRLCLCAAHMALRAVKWNDAPAREIGLVAAGDAGFLQANQNYFRDYVTGGRSMGRGNLFIYTLPTSTLGEVAIALDLTGPSMHLHDDVQPLAALVHHADQIIADGEAGGMLVLWSDLHAAVCLAIDGGWEESPSIQTPSGSTPGRMAHDLAAMARPS